MAWFRDFPVGTLLADVLSLQARLHRLQLLRQVEAVRAQARSLGVSDAALAQLKAQVLRYPLPKAERTALAATAETASGSLKNLIVQSSEDNGF